MPRRSALLACAVLLAACSRSAEPHPDTIGPTNGSHQPPGGNLDVFVPESKARILASKVFLGSSNTEIGQVTALDPVNRYETKLRIVLAVSTRLHTDATATVCANRIRIAPGTPGMPANRYSIITLVHTLIRPGAC